MLRSVARRSRGLADLLDDPRVRLHRIDTASASDLRSQQLAGVEVEMPLARSRSSTGCPGSKLPLTVEAVAHHLRKFRCPAGGHLLPDRAEAPRPRLDTRRCVRRQCSPHMFELE